jgi:hypothetical protein
VGKDEYDLTAHATGPPLFATNPSFSNS